MSTKKSLIQIRTNAGFTVNYDDSTLSPQIELIMLFVEPKYIIDREKDTIIKGQEINEFRIKCNPQGISEMIGELQALQVQLQGFNNMSEGLNAIIKANNQTKE